MFSLTKTSRTTNEMYRLVCKYLSTAPKTPWSEFRTHKKVETFVNQQLKSKVWVSNIKNLAYLQEVSSTFSVLKGVSEDKWGTAAPLKPIVATTETHDMWGKWIGQAKYCLVIPVIQLSGTKKGSRNKIDELWPLALFFCNFWNNTWFLIKSTSLWMRQ